MSNAGSIDTVFSKRIFLDQARDEAASYSSCPATLPVATAYPDYEKKWKKVKPNVGSQKQQWKLQLNYTFLCLFLFSSLNG